MSEKEDPCKTGSSVIFFVGRSNKNVPESDMRLENNLQADRDCAIKLIFIGV
jgi:hypothetical protein